MAGIQIEEKAKAALAAAEATAKFKAYMASQKTQMELDQARTATQSAAMDLVNQAKAKQKKETEARQQKQQAQGSTEEPKTANLPNPQLNQNNPAASLGQGGPSDLLKSTADMELPGVPGAPPFLVNQQRTTEVGPHKFNPVVTAPARTTRQTTQVNQNAINPAQRVRAMQENYRMQQQQRAAQQQKVEETIATEAEDLGGTIFSQGQGEVEEGSIKARYEALEAQYGKEVATRIMIGARANARDLEMDRRKTKFQSDLIEGRTKRGESRRASLAKTKKDEKETKPASLEKDKAAEIRMRILEGKEPTNEEQAFLDVYNKSDPLDIAVRRAFKNSGADTGGKKATQDDVDRVGTDLGITDPTELRSRMEAIGYVFD